MITHEEAEYRLATERTIGDLATAVAALRSEIQMIRWTLSGLGSAGLVLLGWLVYLKG